MSISKDVDFIESRFRERLLKMDKKPTEDEIQEKLKAGRKRYGEVAKLCGNKANDMLVYVLCLDFEFEPEFLATVVNSIGDKITAQDRSGDELQSLAGFMIGNGVKPLVNTHGNKRFAPPRVNPKHYRPRDTLVGRYWDKFGIDIEKVLEKRCLGELRDGVTFSTANGPYDGIMNKTSVEKGYSPITQITLGFMLCDQDLVREVLLDEVARKYVLAITNNELLSNESEILSGLWGFRVNKVPIKVALRDYYTLLLEEARLFTRAFERGTTPAMLNEVMAIDKGRLTHAPLATGLDAFREPETYRSEYESEQMFTLEMFLDSMYDAGLTLDLMGVGECTAREVANNRGFLTDVIDTIDTFMSELYGEVPSESELEELVTDLNKIVSDYDIKHTYEGEDEDDGDYMSFVISGRKPRCEFGTLDSSALEIDSAALTEALVKTMKQG